MKFILWLYLGRWCEKCQDYTGYRFYGDCDTCRLVEYINFRAELEGWNKK